MHSWEEIENFIDHCRGCRLAETRRRPVMGRGSRSAKIMLIAEAPGAQEDAAGVPFVGPAGGMLDRLLTHAGLSREEIYITNILKCHPPGNRNPREDEKDCCMPYLRYETYLLRPQIIVCLGRVAAQRVVAPDYRITRQHGTWIHRKNCDLTAVYHPSAILRDPAKLNDAERDFRGCPALPGARLENRTGVRGVRRPEKQPKYPENYCVRERIKQKTKKRNRCKVDDLTAISSYQARFVSAAPSLQQFFQTLNHIEIRRQPPDTVQILFFQPSGLVVLVERQISGQDLRKITVHRQMKIRIIIFDLRNQLAQRYIGAEFFPDFPHRRLPGRLAFLQFASRKFPVTAVFSMAAQSGEDLVSPSDYRGRNSLYFHRFSPLPHFFSGNRIK